MAGALHGRSARVQTAFDGSKDRNNAPALRKLLMPEVELCGKPRSRASQQRRMLPALNGEQSASVQQALESWCP